MTAKIKSGQGTLLYHLWQIYGGAVSVAKKCGVHQQAPVNWYIRGSVPLEHLSKVVDALNLSAIQKWGLNYKELAYTLPDRPKWKEVVESFPFSKKVKEKILFYAPTPKTTTTKPKSHTAHL